MSATGKCNALKHRIIVPSPFQKKPPGETTDIKRETLVANEIN
jgi:hypothetical protein